MRLKDRVAIVTGGGVGIGRAYCLGLSREGARVVVADVNEAGARETAQMIADQGGEALAVRTDVKERADTEAMASEAIARFGRLDVLVNNAALFTALPNRTFEEITIEEWDLVMAVNVRGPFLCARAVVPHMKERRYGKIINVSSGSILRGNPKRIHYVASKSALVGFTRSLARSLGDYNISVNTLMPGATASESAMSVYPKEHWEQGAASRAFKRIETPEDLVGPLVFLASADSDFITGQSLLVDGGNNMY